jgi:hypothetical protein
MVIVVKPGELMPVDGISAVGSSSISEADHWNPFGAVPGMLVLSGSVNLDGVLEVRASKRSTESKYARLYTCRRSPESEGSYPPSGRLPCRWIYLGAVALAGYPGQFLEIVLCAGSIGCGDRAH